MSADRLYQISVGLVDAHSIKQFGEQYKDNRKSDRESLFFSNDTTYVA